MNYRKNKQRGQNATSSKEEADPYKKLYGTTIPKNIPESSAWWREQSKDLFAVTEEHELGLMSSMVTTAEGESHAPQPYQLEQHIGSPQRRNSVVQEICREEDYA